MGDIAGALSQAGIVPNILPSPPQHQLEVVFAKSLTPGDNLHPLHIRSAPKIDLRGVEVKDGDYFSLLMIDPDYPRREAPTDAAYIHWLIPNINHDSMRRGQATGARANVGFMPPTPIPKSGQHRMLILLFSHHAKKINQPTIKQRTKFSLKDFMQKHGFTAPLAANFFITENDEQ